MPHQQTKIILASSSIYRREILNKLGIDYESVSPDVDESPLENETPTELVARLALNKAKAVASALHKTEEAPLLIIGSDQIAVLDKQIITKPHTHANACQQLRTASNREVTFLTSLCLYNTSTQQHQLVVVPYEVAFLPLTNKQIESYLKKEQPYHCAGSFKSEGLGITLFKHIRGDDPNTLIGLPLIELVNMLRKEGIEPLS